MYRHVGQVILDPMVLKRIEALVVPPMNITCTAPEHQLAFQNMKQVGEVADSLLHVLLSNPEHAAHKETIVRWMVHMSLLVPVREGAKALASPASTPAGHPYLCDGVPSYIAPALLPDKNESE